MFWAIKINTCKRVCQTFPLKLSLVTWVVLLLKICSTSLSSLLYPQNIYRKPEYTWLVYSVKTPVLDRIRTKIPLGDRNLASKYYREADTVFIRLNVAAFIEVKGGFVLHERVCYSTVIQLQIYSTKRACFPVGNPPAIPNNSLFIIQPPFLHQGSLNY